MLFLEAESRRSAHASSSTTAYVLVMFCLQHGVRYCATLPHCMTCCLCPGWQALYSNVIVVLCYAAFALQTSATNAITRAEELQSQLKSAQQELTAETCKAEAASNNHMQAQVD